MRRINIAHVSCKNKENFDTIIELLVNFIWKNDPCQEIRVNLFHYINENQTTLGVNKEI